MAQLHIATASGRVIRTPLRPRQVRVVFDRATRTRRLRPATWHMGGIPLAVLLSLLMWGIAAWFAR